MAIMNRIKTTFNRCREENRKALVMFISAGDPSLAASERLVAGIAAAGADIIEVGVPFSDPMADGSAIQAASQRALAAGTTLEGILEMVRTLRQSGLTQPVVLFSYYNVLLQYGVEKLARDSAAAGVDAWLAVDVPFEEAGEIRPCLQACGLDLITLLAPTTPPERCKKLLQDATGFVYYITVTGVTGARNVLPANLQEKLAEIRKMSPVPVVAGFGISNPEMAREVGKHADGVVVGSALVKMMEKVKDLEQGVQDCSMFVRSLFLALQDD